MQTVELELKPATPYNNEQHNSLKGLAHCGPAGRLGKVERALIWWAIKARIFYFACITLRTPGKIRLVFEAMMALRSSVWGGDLKKIYKINGKYHFNQYTPGWPSKAYDHLIQSELRRKVALEPAPEQLSFIFLAITRKCPLRCEHCFEWDNLNKKESFTREDLEKVIALYQKEGVRQIHFSGGEPMVRLPDLLHLLRIASVHCECWVLTSGFHVTPSTARELKKAGCRGIVVSIDHYLADAHDLFRGRAGSHNEAVAAVSAAHEAGLVVSVSVCATKSFLDGGHLAQYISFAKQLRVQFVQVLEPRKVGRYEAQPVSLEARHIQLLEKTFTEVNHAPGFEAYPTLLYHGYHQRRVGCFSGSRSVYIDSAGDVHACPFCHTKSYNIISLLRQNGTQLPQKENRCPQFEKIA